MSKILLLYNGCVVNGIVFNKPFVQIVVCYVDALVVAFAFDDLVITVDASFGDGAVIRQGFFGGVTVEPVHDGDDNRRSSGDRIFLRRGFFSVHLKWSIGQFDNLTRCEY